MLGHDVMRAGERASHELVPVDLPELDITDVAAVSALVARLQDEPGSLHAILNCAAWTDVDGAESNREPARAVNVDGAS
ncbi:MAG: dTDP-4-dehydrorhamnose reductase, partial [Gaiellales bacterium]|nr:dTDP-4-dehydrorhamnose reductase [Gaiellales bacterium]